ESELSERTVKVNGMTVNGAKGCATVNRYTVTPLTLQSRRARNCQSGLSPRLSRHLLDAGDGRGWTCHAHRRRSRSSVHAWFSLHQSQQVPRADVPRGTPALSANPRGRK